MVTQESPNPISMEPRRLVPVAGSFSRCDQPSELALQPVQIFDDKLP